MPETSAATIDIEVLIASYGSDGMHMSDNEVQEFLQAHRDGQAWRNIIAALPKDLPPEDTFTVEATWDPLDVPPETIIVYVEDPEGEVIASGFAKTLEVACTQALRKLESHLEKENYLYQQAVESAEMLDGFPDEDDPSVDHEIDEEEPSVP